MNTEQMTKLTEAANLLRQAEARIEAVRDGARRGRESAGRSS